MVKMWTAEKMVWMLWLKVLMFGTVSVSVFPRGIGCGFVQSLCLCSYMILAGFLTMPCLSWGPQSCWPPKMIWEGSLLFSKRSWIEFVTFSLNVWWNLPVNHDSDFWCYKLLLEKKKLFCPLFLSYVLIELFPNILFPNISPGFLFWVLPGSSVCNKI